MWITNPAAPKTPPPIGSWLEDEKSSIEGRPGFFSRRFCLDGCVMCERLGGPLAGLLWIMAQGQAALIHRQGKSSGSERQLRTVMLPSYLLPCLSLKSYNSTNSLSHSSVVCSVYWLYWGAICSRVYRSECMYTHCSCICVLPCRCETSEWQTIHTKLPAVYIFLFLTCAII